ncbi:hypothetical protein GCM10010923_17520 [Blastomonas marina]|uniref:diguanylate cyclase n=1 Tax=Blastomonas marina TaxID=1867408 RepID=A0ABQ1FDC4_9SPHN|nr:diguanylate cyclase [Blastomonas marina]GGA07916.1 hypothetical protein GCM10010923_17520 [Blastomonas marina]
MSDRVDNAGITAWWAPLAFALGYGLLAVLALVTTRTADGIAVIWPSSGVLLAGLMLLKGNARIALLLLVGIASMVVNLVFNQSWLLATGFTAGNLAGGMIASRISLDGNRAWGRFDDPVWVARFFFGAVIASASGAMIAATLPAIESPLEFAGSWFSTVLLGQLIVAPTLVILYQGRHRRLLSRDMWLKAIVILLAGAASIAVAFFQTRFALLFLPLTVTVFATYLLGVTGALGMLMLVTIGGSTAAALDRLPTGFTDDPIISIYMLQLYLLTVFASALPLSTLLEKSRRQAQELARRNTLLETAEAFANVGHWRYDVESGEIEWSDEMYRIFGLDPDHDEPQDLNSGAIDAEHVEIVRAAFREAIISGKPFDYKIRIRRPSGELRFVHSSGYVERSEMDRSDALFGVFKDITNHVEAMGKLEQAWVQAEQDVRKALLLSETDQLTGVANRRKLLTMLAREMETADETGRDLAIIMLDVDHFKAINDTHGHGVGDLVLQKIAGAGRSCLRDQDLFGRLGGEEFLVILPGADAELAAKVAERLRHAVHELSGDPELGLDRLTVSLGVALHQTGADESFFLQAADAALYQSKADGRNRLTVARADAA